MQWGLYDKLGLRPTLPRLNATHPVGRYIIDRASWQQDALNAYIAAHSEEPAADHQSQLNRYCIANYASSLATQLAIEVCEAQTAARLDSDSPAFRYMVEQLCQGQLTLVDQLPEVVSGTKAAMRNTLQELEQLLQRGGEPFLPADTAQDGSGSAP